MAEEGQVISCHTIEQWREHFDGAKNSGKLVVVDFTATWCGPCRIMAPIFEELAKTTPNVLFLKVDVDELNDVAMEFKVDAMPTFVFIKRGASIDRVVGTKKEELQSRVATYSKL